MKKIIYKNPEITLKKVQFGRVLYRPICKNAEIITQLTSTKTLTKSHLILLKKLGFKIRLLTTYKSPQNEPIHSQDGNA